MGLAGHGGPDADLRQSAAGGANRSPCPRPLAEGQPAGRGPTPGAQAPRMRGGADTTRALHRASACPFVPTEAAAATPRLERPHRAAGRTPAEAADSLRGPVQLHAER